MSSGRARIAALLSAGLLTPVLVTGCGPSGGPASTPSPTSAPAASGASDLASVLVRAVTEERKVKATYDNVLASLGAVAPFTQITQAEAAHVAALERVARVHGVDVSGAKASGDPSPRTLVDACRLGVTDEMADVALYDELLPKVSAYPDVTSVLTNLRAASQNSHLPAFRRCA
ncbi:hypothetical protein [Amycolatopsis benzoatilytica]|uniref:hypothetical protein n=1 Tax=Amycolatopsis benzoatilytica TaxID=346045 RepID=UPI00035D449D|nr:hypothetical protein [Amycolatopsis benzoatilytica]